MLAEEVMTGGATTDVMTGGKIDGMTGERKGAMTETGMLHTSITVWCLQVKTESN